jgi:hypothetical protein
MKELLLIFFGLLLAGWGKLPGQTAICHFDRPYYLPGQYIHYALNTGLETTDSFMLSMTLHDGERIFDQHFLQVKEGRGVGYFQVPFEFKPGIYYCQADVFTPTADAINILTTPVTIFSDDPRQAAFDFKLGEAPSGHLENSGITIEMDPVVHSRQNVSCHITVKGGQAGDYISIAVRDKQLYPAGNPVVTKENQEIQLPLLDYVPIRGNRIIQNTRPNPKAFLFACQPDAMNFRFNRVNDDGSFLIRMTPFFGKKPFYFIDNGGNEINISLSGITPLGKPAPTMLLDENLKSEVGSNLVRKKIYELYAQVEEVAVMDDLPVQEPVVPPDFDIDVQDYAIRGTLKDLLKEIITPFKFRKANNDQYQVKVLYEVLDLKYFYDSDPIFFINGVATRDYTFIANLPLQEIKRFKIYARLEKIRDLKLVDIGGVGILEMVDPLYTLTADQHLPSAEIQGIQLPYKYPVEADIASEVPQLKALLYWMPRARLDQQGSYHFVLPTSDDISQFEIEVVHGRLQKIGRSVFETRYHPVQH